MCNTINLDTFGTANSWLLLLFVKLILKLLNGYCRVGGDAVVLSRLLDLLLYVNPLVSY